ncbi:hypothetical protein [Microlunatus antarcticus]|uniref:Cellulose synthase n=1 Tax=Microlunatus antarcticus TaxID=53388 RepID=A0A7W5JUC1_9ACTN|nr:hypothetical protein [Microlunatus antarcticus]MBB3326216.1 hypothetical protein [Microlunatus antarcticus]
MPAVDVVLLPLCIGLSLLGVVVAVVLFLRGRRGRALQGLAFALAVTALYLVGLLRLVWDAVVAVVRWATGNVFDLTAWIGFGLLALSVVLWFVGRTLGRRSRRAAKAAPAGSAASKEVTGGKAAAGQPPAGRAPATTGGRQTKAAAPAQDDDMAEIEALLKSRGIQ